VASGISPNPQNVISGVHGLGANRFAASTHHHAFVFWPFVTLTVYALCGRFATARILRRFVTIQPIREKRKAEAK